MEGRGEALGPASFVKLYSLFIKIRVLSDKYKKGEGLLVALREKLVVHV